MANDYGLPPNNALSAWLGVRDSNNRQSALNQQQTAQQVGILGQLAQMAAQQEAQKRAELARQSLGGLGPNATMDDIIRSVAPHVQNPDNLTNWMIQNRRTQEQQNRPVVVPPGSVLTRDGKEVFVNQNQRPQAGTQTERAFGLLLNLQKKADSGQPLTDEEEMAARTAHAMLSRQETRLDPVTNQFLTYNPLTIPPEITVGRGNRQPAQPLAPGATPTLASQGGPVPVMRPVDVPGPAPGTGGRKPLDAGTEKEFQGLGDAAKQLADLTQTVGDNFGGWVLDSVADAALAAGRRLPVDVLEKTPGLNKPGLKHEAEWWMKYRNWANDVRAAKFGLTLTGNELQAFNAATPKQSDDPETIRNGLKTQMELIRGKLGSRMEAVRTSGQNVEQAQSLAGPDRLVVDPATTAVDKSGVSYDVDAVRRLQQAGNTPTSVQIRRPKTKAFKVDGGGSVVGTLGADGNYYTVREGKRFRIEE
jgi:hypothetical protein